MYNKHLDTFIVVADSGSFSKASEKLFNSPNAVMKQINLLENNLGIQLFIRSKRGLTLTKAGELIYRDAKYMINRSQKTLAEARSLAQPEEMLVRIGTSILNSSYSLMKLWKDIQNLYPEMKIQIIPFDDSNENFMHLISHLGEKIDIVLGLFPSTLHGGSCNALELRRFPLCCAMPFGHPLAQKEKLTIKDLYGERLIMVARGDTAYIDALRDEIEQYHHEIEIIDVPYYDISTFNLCETSNALMITAENWSNVHPTLVVVPVDWNYYVPYGLIYSLHPSEAVRTFISAVKTIM